MLVLLSTMRPTATGTSTLLKNVMVWGLLSSVTENACCGRFGTASDRPSNTLTCSTTRSDSLLKTGAAGSCAWIDAATPSRTIGINVRIGLQFNTTGPEVDCLLTAPSGPAVPPIGSSEAPERRRARGGPSGR